MKIMREKILFTAAMKKQKGSLICIFVLLFIISLSVFSSITLYSGGAESVSAEMDRLGFGDFTAWVSGDEESLTAEAESVEQLWQVEQAVIQPLIFAGYEIGGKYSDNEGQLIVYDGSVPYKTSPEIAEAAEIADGTVYISPAMQSAYDIDIGGTISFELSRQDGTISLTVAGYFEDAFMGSSMIDMKSFLISEADYLKLREIISSSADYDVLGRSGAMVHIFQSGESDNLSADEFQKLIYSETSLSQYTEFSYSKQSILSYMLLLQNIMTGFLIAFSGVLLIICLIVTGHSLSDVIEQNKRDMAILKTLGLSGGDIRRIYLVLYGGAVLLGLLLGIAPSYALAHFAAAGMVSSTGMLIMVKFPIIAAAVVFSVLTLLFWIFLQACTAKIMRVSPMQTIREKSGAKKTSSPICKSALSLSIAVRELLSGKRKYIGSCIIAALLVIFLSIVGKMGAWLGVSGEGLMNAFSAAEHDLGVQPFNDEIDMAEIERVISWYSPIADKYELAMESVTVNGQEYTANVLDDARRFHILSGEVCGGGEILITETVANEQGLSIGDAAVVAANGRIEEYTVSGIYQCANGMGSNIGMSLAGYSKIGNINGFIWCCHYILENGAVRDYAMKYLQESYRGIDVHTNSWSGLDGIVLLIHALIVVIYVVAALFILVSVFLVSGKLMQSEAGNMAIYMSLGIRSSRLRLSFALRFLIVVSIGAVIGAVISEGFADGIIGAVFKAFGIGDFSSGFSFMGTVLPPVIIILLFFIFAWLFSRNVRRMSLVRMISENDE